MQFLAHSGGYNTGEPEGFSHFMREDGLKLLFISFIFIAVTYAVTVFITKQPIRVKKSSKEDSND